MKLPSAICFIVVKAETKCCWCHVKCACYFQISLLSGCEAFQTKTYHLWLDPATVNSALCEIHALFGWF